MKVDKRVLHADVFKILPNKFRPLEADHIDADNFHRIKRNCICFMTQKKRWEDCKKKMKSHFEL